MNAIAVDDEPLALEVVRTHAAKVPFLQLKAEFTDAFQALAYLQKENIDLIFLDIKMPDISGIEFFKSLHRRPLLIFTTAYPDHAVTSFELDAIDYLLKPFPLSRFIQACNKAYELYTFRHTTEVQDHLYIKTGSEQVKVMYDDIYYLEATGNYVTFVLNDKKVLARSTFAEAIHWMPHQKFVRVHRSYVVAVSKIEKVERHQVTIGAHKIPISEAYQQQLQLMLK